MNKKYDYCVFIGRFQPFLNSDLENLKQALSVANKVIVVIGSSFVASSVRNPWKDTLRHTMINEAKSTLEDLGYEIDVDQLYVVYARDHFYNDLKWVMEIQKEISDISEEDCITNPKICIIGNDKLSITKYLSKFPQWDLIQTGAPQITSEEFCDQYFINNQDKTHLKTLVPSKIWKLLKTSNYNNLVEEFNFVKEYKKAWSSAPYPPTFVTVDTVVIKSGHILVIQRGFNPGKGLLALPGGFLDQDENTKDGAIRELKEETKIKLPKPILYSSIKEYKVFDHPYRSSRGRTITHCYLLDLGDGELPKVKGGDDADKAIWMPLNEVDKNECKFFEDHWHIITYMTNV